MHQENLYRMKKTWFVNSADTVDRYLSLLRFTQARAELHQANADLRAQDFWVVIQSQQFCASEETNDAAVHAVTACTGSLMAYK